MNVSTTDWDMTVPRLLHGQAVLDVLKPRADPAATLAVGSSEAGQDRHPSAAADRPLGTGVSPPESFGGYVTSVIGHVVDDLRSGSRFPGGLVGRRLGEPGAQKPRSGSPSLRGLVGRRLGEPGVREPVGLSAHDRFGFRLGKAGRRRIAPVGLSHPIALGLERALRRCSQVRVVKVISGRRDIVLVEVVSMGVAEAEDAARRGAVLVLGDFDVQDLQASREGLVLVDLTLTSFELVVVPSSAGGDGIVHGHAMLLDHVEMIQSVSLDLAVVEPRTVARLPFRTAYHAKLGGATTGHMVAAFLELDHGGAVVAALPAFAPCHLDEPICLLVPRAVSTAVPFPVAHDADPSLTSTAPAKLPSAAGASGAIDVDVRRFDPLATAPGRTIDTILRRVLLILTIPLHLELDAEQSIDVFERDMIRRTAPRWHVLGVGDRQQEYAPQASMTHDVTTS